MCNKKKKKKRLFNSSWAVRFSRSAAQAMVCFVAAFTIAVAPVITSIALAEDEGVGTPVVTEVGVTDPAPDLEVAPVTEPVAEEVAGDQVVSAPTGDNPGGSQTEGLVSCPPEPDPDPNPEVPCGENAIINGDFETPIVSGGWDIYDSYAPGLNWVVKWMPGDNEFGGQYRPRIAHLELQKNVNSWLPQLGNQYAELDTDWDGPSGSLNGEPASVKIYQDLTTIPGKEYQISFYFSPRPGTPLEDNILEFSWGGSVIDTISEAGGSNTNWTLHSYTLTATGNVTRVQFTDLGGANSLGTFVDNVVVYQICEQIPDPCQPGPGWASVYEGGNQGTRKDGSAVVPDRSDPNTALGEPDGKFFSLGKEGGMVVSFTNYVMNVPGDDLSFHEVTYGRESYPEETALILVSQDKEIWHEIGTASNHNTDGITYLDFGSTGLSWIKYVRLIDTTNFDPHSNDADGYDIDAIDATSIICNYVQIDKTGTFDFLTNTINYVVNWSVVGTGTAYDVKVVDTIPVETEFVSATPVPNSIAGQIITWELGDLPGGSSGSINLVVELLATTGVDVWADSVVSFMQGLKWNGTPVIAERSHPEKALGEPENNDTVNFVSLGFGDNQGNGELVLGFDNYIINDVGPDISVVETSYGNPSEESYPETAKVYASKDNSDWTFLKTIVLDDDDIDLGSLGWAKYIKLVDISDKSKFGDSETTDGFDVDGVTALNSMPNVCQVENSVAINALTKPKESGEGPRVTDEAKFITNINQLACQPPADEDVTIIAHKIVCDSENELPNWGNGGPDITADTAQDWVASHKSCRFAPDWDFQWGPQNAYDPGDTLVGPANEPWKNMPPTDSNGMTTTTLSSEDIGSSSYLWFREELEEDYISFTFGQNGDTNVDPVSAELYCHVDVLNYDNYDRIDGIELGKTYNCIGFNAPSEMPAGSVSGMKFSDHNRNHQKDEGEEGLPGWRIGAVKGVETLYVDSHGEVTGTPISTSFDSVAGREYFFRASSTFDAGDLITADAKYSVREPNTTWTDIVQNYEIYGPTLLDLHINGIAVNWGPYNGINHAYWYNMLGDGNPFIFQIYDIFASNNSGQLKVQIWELLRDDYTDADGNYYIDLTGIDGSVVVAEARQRGWIQTFPGNEGPDSFYAIPTNSDSTGLDFGNYNTAGDENGGGGFDLVETQAASTGPVVNDDDEGGGNGGGGGGGGGGSGNPGSSNPTDNSGAVLGDQQNGGGVGGGDVLGELVSAGVNAWTALLTAVLFGLLMTGIVYRYPELLVCKKPIKK